MNFVDEDNGALPSVGFAYGGGHNFLDFLNTGQHRAERDKFRTREAGYQACERGFAAARRTPQQDRSYLVVFDLLAEGFAGAEKPFLADEFIEGARAHALSERLMRGIFKRGLRQLVEEAHDLAPVFSDKELRWRAAS